jgi:hypothetical protein
MNEVYYRAFRIAEIKTAEGGKPLPDPGRHLGSGLIPDHCQAIRLDAILDDLEWLITECIAL